MFLLWCSHKKLTRPFTNPQSRRETHVVCLSCTRQFEYDLDAMKVGKEIPRPEPRMAVAR